MFRQTVLKCILLENGEDQIRLTRITEPSHMHLRVGWLEPISGRMEEIVLICFK